MTEKGGCGCLLTQQDKRSLVRVRCHKSSHDPFGPAPLHWAALHGNAEMTREILKYRPSLEQIDRTFKGTPRGWAIHGSEHGWYAKTGDYPAVVELLLNAGAKSPEDFAKGTEAVRAVLRKFSR